MPDVLITGASQGIGKRVALAFAREPASRLALVARNTENLERVAAACENVGATAHVFSCDVTDPEQVAAMAAQVQERMGTPNVLVNNAGVFRPGPIAELELDLFRQQIDVNLVSAFLVTKAFLPALMRRQSGRVIFLGSVASVKGYAGGAAYCAAKHGLLGFARTLREETKEAGIQVTTVMPGATLTPSWDGVDLPEDRFMPPEDVARAIVEICGLSDRTVVEELLLRPQLGDI